MGKPPTWKLTLRVSFNVSCSSTRLKWKCRCHQVESIVPLEHGGWAAYVETNPNSQVPPSLLALAKPKKLVLKNTTFKLSTLSSPEHSWQMVCHGLKVEVWGLNYWPLFKDCNLQCPSKYTSPKTNPSKRNLKLKMKMSLGAHNILCMAQEPTSVGHCQLDK